MKQNKTKKGLLVFITSMLISNIGLSAPASLQANNTMAFANVMNGLNDATIEGTTKAALIGAGVGPLTNAAAGQYMSHQESELRTATLTTLKGVSVVRDGNRIHLFLPAPASFTKNNADINSDLAQILDAVATIEKKYNSTVIHITGNAEATEADQNNIGLKRANNVAAYLQYKGIPVERLHAASNGARNEMGSNDSEKGRKANRRVDITLIPLTN
jgi:outer membrane protein OmpA-like peptidoglycan-associated protein